MDANRTLDKVIRTIRLDDGNVCVILDRLDRDDRLQANHRSPQRHAYRATDVVIHIEQTQLSAPMTQPGNRSEATHPET